jgi:tRNA uridine 5-carbamoylmethylation protein Kti12
MKNRENIIVDMTNVSKKSRKKFLGQIPNKEYHKKAIVFITGLDEISKRNANRPNKYIPDEVYLKMMTGFSYPTYDEFDEIVEVM